MLKSCIDLTMQSTWNPQLTKANFSSHKGLPNRMKGRSSAITARALEWKRRLHPGHLQWLARQTKDRCSFRSGCIHTPGVHAIRLKWSIDDRGSWSLRSKSIGVGPNYLPFSFWSYPIGSLRGFGDWPNPFCISGSERVWTLSILNRSFEIFGFKIIVFLTGVPKETDIWLGIPLILERFSGLIFLISSPDFPATRGVFENPLVVHLLSSRCSHNAVPSAPHALRVYSSCMDGS